MPSTPTASLRIELQAALENDTTWGAKANAALQQLEDAITGYVSVTQGDVANYTLSALNYTTDEARNMYVRVTGAITAQRNVVCPTAEKLYFVENATTGGFDIVFKTTAGTGINIPAGKKRIVMCDGTNVIDALNDLATASTIAGVEIVTLSASQTLTNKSVIIKDVNFSIIDDADVTKIAKFEASAISTATTRTFTLPNASDTLVVANGTQTLTNKTLDNTNTITLKDTLFTIQDDVDVTKQVKFQLSGLTTATTYTWAFPNSAGDTVVGAAATQTLTNKTLGLTNTFNINDALLTFSDNLDGTKQVAFQLSGITTATLRTWSFPDVSDTFVGLTATQTLTNKTLSGVTLTSLDANTTIQDNVDPTKQLQFQLSGITTATTRTLTVPDVNDTILTLTGVGSGLSGIRKQGKETIWVTAAAMVAPVTNGATVGSTEGTNFSYRTLDFSSANTKLAYFNVAMPKSWNLGTVTFIPYWTASAGTAAQTCTWSVNAVALSDDDVFDSAVGTAQTSADALIVTGDMHIGPESSAITIAGTISAGDIVVFKIGRTAGTLTGDAKLIGIKILYTTNAADDT